MASRSNGAAAAAAAAAKPFVKNNPRLGTLIEVAASLAWVFTTALYIAAAGNLLRSLNLEVALGIIALLTPCFVVVWRTLSFYKDAAMDLAGKMTLCMGTIPAGKMPMQS
ncbi:unnamed protein product [Urochloa humidicola]